MPLVILKSQFLKFFLVLIFFLFEIELALHLFIVYFVAASRIKQFPKHPHQGYKYCHWCACNQGLNKCIHFFDYPIIEYTYLTECSISSFRHSRISSIA